MGPALAHGPAFSKLVTRSKTAGTSTGGEKISAKVKCPGAKRRVSGGFASNLEKVQGPVMLRSTAAHRRSWRAGASVFVLIGENYHLTSFVNCARHAPHETVEKDSKTIKKGQRKSATAVCPMGRFREISMAVL